MRIYIYCVALLLAGCATPSASYSKLDANTGDLEGRIKLSLPQADLQITRTVQRRQDQPEVVNFRIEAQISASEHTYLIEPNNRLWSETRLNPTYVEGTTVLSSLSVETLDKTVSTLTDLVGFAAAIGADLTVGIRGDSVSGDEACFGRVDSSTLYSTMPKDRAGKNGVALPLSEQCELRADFGDIAPDAISRTQFESLFADGRTRLIPSAACREVSVSFLAGARRLPIEPLRVLVPDANYVRVTQMPVQGKMDFTKLCSPPSVVSEDSEAGFSLSKLTDLVNLFQNEEEGSDED